MKVILEGTDHEIKAFLTEKNGVGRPRKTETTKPATPQAPNKRRKHKRGSGFAWDDEENQNLTEIARVVGATKGPRFKTLCRERIPRRTYAACRWRAENVLKL
jgi:hypothetical protein